MADGRVTVGTRGGTERRASFCGDMVGGRSTEPNAPTGDFATLMTYGSAELFLASHVCSTCCNYP